MSTGAGRRGAPAAVGLALLLLAGCGVAVQSEPERVPRDRLVDPTAAPGDPSLERARAWGVRDERLVPLFVELPAPGVAPRLRALLAVGDAGQAPTAIPAGTRLLSVTQRDGRVRLEVGRELREVPERRLPLALGQLVLTATEEPGVQSVLVLVERRPVPLLDEQGLPVLRALRRSDFTDLAAPRPAPERS